MRPWGKMAKLYGVYSFGLSPFEQKAFGEFGSDMYKLGRMFLENWWALIPVPIFYSLREYGMKQEEKRLRKNPAAFANDV
ncbi:alanine tRNA ligase [Trichuris trichiura]|uniref:Cytochrome b-c1 complex subunit 8 n=1 Tax=Trichuris trichiura TaxID=36087 RepID=A0A077Z8Z0_TRITR|nr:alanine tRNA ligase [Trichuris trichiura]